MIAVKTFREKLGLSMEEFAKSLNMSVSMYEKIEYGYREPSRKFIKKLKEVYPYFDTNIFFEYEVHENET